MGILRMIRCGYCTYEAKSDDELRNHYQKVHMSEKEDMLSKEHERTSKRRYKEIYR